MTSSSRGIRHSTTNAVFFALLATSAVLAQPATVQFRDCFSGNISQKLNISTVYAQVLHNEGKDRHLNITVLGQAGQDITGQSPESTSLGV